MYKWQFYENGGYDCISDAIYILDVDDELTIVATLDLASPAYCRHPDPRKAAEVIAKKMVMALNRPDVKYRTKISNEDVILMRKLKATEDLSGKELSERFGISVSEACGIVRGERRANLGGPRTKRKYTKKLK